MKQDSFKKLFRKSKFVQYDAKNSAGGQVLRTLMADLPVQAGLQPPNGGGQHAVHGIVDTQFGLKRIIPQEEKTHAVGSAKGNGCSSEEHMKMLICQK